MDNYKMTLYKDNKVYDITKLVGGLSLKDNIDTLGVSLDFAKANSDEYHLKQFDIVDVGDKILLTNNGKEVFRGIITDESKTGKFGRSYTAYDYMFYCNKSKLKPTQIKKQSASNAIADLCRQINIPVYKITSIKTIVSGIYKDKTFAEILKDILEKATQELGIRYKVELHKGGLYIAKLSELEITATYTLTTNFDVTKAVGNDISRTFSIADMSNSVIVTSSDDKNNRVYATAKDNQNIDKYGLLQTNISVDSKDLPQASNIARNKLKELNKIIENTTVTLLGNDTVKSGRILTFKDKDLIGKYLVLDVTHTINNGIHKMNLNLERWN